MKRYIYRIVVAFLTLTIGISLTSIWIIRHYSEASNPVKSTPIESLQTTKVSLPCVVSQRDIESVKKLLVSGIDVDSTADSCINVEPSPRGVTLLMKSAEDGDIETVKLLLENGANVNASDSWKTTPLYYALDDNRIELVRLLVENGADINAKNERGRTTLMSAASGGDVKVIEYLLSKGVDINARDENGTTALMSAAGHKKSKAMALLLEKGANPSLKDNKGRTVSDYEKNGFPNEYIIAKS